MNPKYIVSHLDQQLGPFEENELKSKWEKGELLPIDYVYVEGKSDWVLLSEQFAWAKMAPGTPTPPPLQEVTAKKTLPPEPPPQESLAANVPLQVVAAPAPAALPAGTRVELVSGEADIELASFEPGQIELLLQSSAGRDLTLHAPVKIQIKSPEPQRIEWSCSDEQTVGFEVQVHMQALDQGGHECTHYSDQFSITMSGAENEEFPVAMVNGKAIVKIKHTKAEICKLQLKYAGARSLEMPKAHSLDWQPGEASKLIIDGPQEYISGYPLKVHVKAVDNFGNLAKTYHGTIVLEVKAS